MIKVSRVTPYIPINILQIKFIELTVYSSSLIPLFFFHSFTLNCRPVQIAYARFEEEIRKETQFLSDSNITGHFFFICHFCCFRATLQRLINSCS
ncbi:hypothetical protein ALC53_00505 [Atta colombica]|uniref:Uncharacterized protein n=1 Tax=Atta colombica TaxID=520822 RepID=A0A195BYF3_9HYME|nr:hypothetical protein ALC53_00505 [Atta colombica]